MKMRPLADITKVSSVWGWYWKWRNAFFFPALQGEGHVLVCTLLPKLPVLLSYSGTVLWGFSTLITEQNHLIPWAKSVSLKCLRFLLTPTFNDCLCHLHII